KALLLLTVSWIVRGFLPCSAVNDTPIYGVVVPKFLCKNLASVYITDGLWMWLPLQREVRVNSVYRFVVDRLKPTVVFENEKVWLSKEIHDYLGSLTH